MRNRFSRWGICYLTWYLLSSFYFLFLFRKYCFSGKNTFVQNIWVFSNRQERDQLCCRQEQRFWCVLGILKQPEIKLYIFPASSGWKYGPSAADEALLLHFGWGHPSPLPFSRCGGVCNLHGHASVSTWLIPFQVRFSKSSLLL